MGLGFLLYHRFGVLSDAAYPTLGLGVLYAVLLGVTLAEAEIQRRALQHHLGLEAEAAGRLAGEMEAARRIQLGIFSELVPLPSPFRTSKCGGDWFIGLPLEKST